MILTSTYRQTVELRKDLLAAFSSLDHGTTACMNEDQLRNAFHRLVIRLCAIVAIHGTDKVRDFLGFLKAEDKDEAVEVVSAFLATGTAEKLALADIASELQQEIVHFSRIVDIGNRQFIGPESTRALRRLQGSDRIPESVKVLSELMVVARSRLKQKGVHVTSPSLRPGQPVEIDIDTTTTATGPSISPDYWMAISCSRRRLRRKSVYGFTNLLAYLTPLEAGLALWAHIMEERPKESVSVFIAFVDEKGPKALRWQYRPSSNESDPIDVCLKFLPEVDELNELGLPGRLSIGDLTVFVQRSGGRVAVACGEESIKATSLISSPSSPPSRDSMATNVLTLLRDYTGPEVKSIECAHIHLDRDIDEDQETGLALGVAALDYLSGVQKARPVLTPMMDDDHVLVKLTPSKYQQFLQTQLGNASMHLIPESSPIIRAIVTAMFERLQLLELDGRCRRRGSNLFLGLPDGTYCELFEDVDGEAITGCIFFETALLVYRSAPVLFDNYFTDRFQLAEGVHKTASSILDGDEAHDRKVALLNDYYRTFSLVTDPHRPDQAVLELVGSVLQMSAPRVAHLNILEDYYEVQQGKVRKLLRLLGLPIRLVSLHFGAQTGRVSIDG